MKRNPDGSHTFSSSEASRISGVPPRNINYWAHTGLVKPLIPATGTGSDSRYSDEDIVVLAAMGMMTDALGKCTTACRQLVVDAIRNDKSSGLLKVVASRFVSLELDLRGFRKLFGDDPL
jgi:hypothetical protein